MSQEQHTLTTQIVTEFSESTNNINEFKEKFESLNNTFATLSDNIYQASQDAQKFDLKIAKRLEEAVKQIKDGAITVDGKSIKEQIEERLGDAISQRRIFFKDLTDDTTTPLQVKLSETARKRLIRKIEKYLSDISKTAELPTDVGEVKVVLNKRTLQNLRTQFGQQLTDLIDENVKFDVEPDVEKLNRFPLLQSQINTVIFKVRDEFNKVLNKPGFVNLDESKIPPIEFSSDELKKAVDKFKNALGNIDQHLGGINTKDLDNLPNIEDKLKQFKSNIETLVWKVYSVIKGFDDLEKGKDIDFSSLQQAIKDLRETATERVLGILTDLQKELHATKPNAREYANELKVLDGIEKQIQSFINTNIKYAEQALEEALNIKIEQVDGQKIKAPSIKKLQRQVIRAAQEAVKNLDLGDLHIDVEQTKAMFNAWAKDTSDKMQMVWMKELAPLQTDLIASNKKVLEQFVSSIVDLTKLKFNDTTDNLVLDIELNTKAIRKQVESKLKEVANTLVANINFSEAGERSLQEGIVLPKKVADTMNKTVRQLLEQQTNRLTEQIQERKGKNFSEAHLEKFDKVLFEQSTKLIGDIVEQAHHISKSLSEGIESSGFKNFSADEQRKIKEHFTETATKMVQDYSDMMDQALGTFIIAGSVAEDVHKKIEQQLNKLLQNMPVQFDDSDKPLILKGLVSKAQRKLQNAIKENVENWEPESQNFSPSIDYDNVIDPIQKAINRMLNKLGDEIATQINGVIVPKSAVDRNQKAIANANDPTYVIDTKKLHKDVRKFLADEEELKVKDWEKQIQYSGDEGLGRVMSANIAVIMKKFHEAIGRHTKDAIELYHDELEGIKTTPNTESVNFLAIKLNQLQDDIEKKIKNLIEQQFNVLSKAIKEIKLKPFSISFDDGNLNEAFAEFIRKNVKNASTFTAGGGKRRKAHTDETYEGTGQSNESTESRSVGFDRNLPVSIMSDYPSVVTNDPFALPGGSRKYMGRIGEETDDKDPFRNDEERDLYIRGARIAVQNAKNRFANKLDPHSEIQFFDYLDNRYIPEVLKIAELSRMATQPEERAYIREMKTYIAQELKMAIELMRKQLAGEKFKDQVEDFKFRQEGFRDDMSLKAESIRTRFLGTLDGDDFERFSNLLNDIIRRSDAISNRKVFELGDIVDLKRSMQSLERELRGLSAVANRVAKENKFGYEIEKLGNKVQHLVSKGDLPLTLFTQFQDMLESVSSKTDLDRIKDFYADMVSQQREIDKQRRNGEREAESFDKKRSRLEDSLAIYSDNALFNALKSERNFSRKLTPEHLSELQGELGGFRTKVQSLSDHVISSPADIDFVKQAMRELNNELRDINNRYQNLVADDKFDVNLEKLRYKLQTLRDMGKLSPEKLDTYENILDKVSSPTDLARARTELQKLLDEQREIIRNERESKTLANKKANITTRMGMFRIMNEQSVQKLRDDFSHKLTKENYEVLNDELDNYIRKVHGIQNMSISDEEQIKRVNDVMKVLNRELAGISQKYREIARGEVFEITKEKLERSVDRLVAQDTQGLLPKGKIEGVREQIRNLRDSTPDLERVKMLIDDIQQEFRDLKKLRDQEEKDKREEKKKGELLTQNELLKGNLALQNETLQSVLKMVPALSNYNVEQIKVNNATDTWSARLRDAEGNVRSLAGTLDRATGELYQHSDALSLVTRQASALQYGGGRGYLPGNRSIFERYYQKPDYENRFDYNPNGDFTSSVVNTMRYITAGALIGAPTMAFYHAWESAKEFDYQMERARQNFLIKGDLNPENYLRDVATKRVVEANPDTPIEDLMEQIEAERQDLLTYAYGKEARKRVQDIALAYAIPTEEAAKAFHIGSRSVDDPKEALAVTQAVARGNAIEEIDAETAAAGLESIMNQYGIRGFAANKVMDMMIMAAQYSPAKLEDFLAMQQRAGSIFKDNLPGMTKGEAIATSIGLTGIFSQATARSGAEAGTFFKAFLPRFYTGEGLKALKEASAQAGFEDLNPFNEDGSKKDFVEILSTFLEKSLVLQDKDRMALWKKVIPGWHIGSAGAMDSFLNTLQQDLEKQISLLEKATGETAGDLDGDGVVSHKEALQWYFDRIKDVDPEQIRLLQLGTLSTWDKRTQAVKTMWSASTFEVFEALKDEFSILAQHLTVFMRLIRDNAEQVATAITLASKIAVGLGARFAWTKMAERIDESDKAQKEERFGKVDRYLGAEQQALNLQRMAIQEQMLGKDSKLADISNRKAELGNKLRENESKKSKLIADRDDFLESLKVVEKSHDPAKGIDNTESIRQTKQVINDLNDSIEQLDREAKKLKSSFNELEQEEKQVKSSSQQLDDEMQQINRRMMDVNNRVEMLSRAYEDMGLDSSKLKTKVQELNSEFVGGVTDAQRYESAINKIGKEANMSDDQLARFREELDRINREFQEGTLGAKQYIKQMERLERAHMTGSAGIQGGGVGKNPINQSGPGLVDAIIAGSMFAPLMMGRRGLIDRMRDFSKTKSLKSLFGKGVVAKDADGNELRDLNGNLIYEHQLRRNKKLNESYDANSSKNRFKDLFRDGGKLEEVGKAGGKVGTIFRGLKGVPALGTALLAFEALNWGTDALTSMGMKAGERAKMSSDNLLKMAQQVKGVDDAAWYNPMKYLGAAALGSEVLFQGMNNLLGGNGVSFKNSFKMLKNMFGKEGEELEKALNDENYQLTKDINGNLKEVKDQAEELYHKDLDIEQLEDPFGDSLDEQTDAEQEQLEELQKLNEQIQKIENKLSRALSINQSEMTMERSKLLLQGVDEDSQQMRDLMDEFLRKNIADIDTALSDISAQKESMADKDSEEYKDLEAREKDLQAQKAQAELQIRQNEMSEFDEIMNNLAEDLKETENEYGIQKAEAQMSGADTDSAIIKKIEAERVSKSNALIEQAQSDLQQLIKDTNAQGSELTKIQQAILELEKDQKENLVSIKQALEKTKTTFNLPSGVNPVSYMDYMMSKNTHTNVTAKAGDVTINLTIGNMSGSQSDVKKMTDSLTDAIRKANQQMAQSFNNQVLGGFGVGYR